MRLTEKQQLLTMITVFAVLLIAEGSLVTYCLKSRTEMNQKLEELSQQEREAREKIAQIPRLRESSAQLAQIIEEYAEILPSEREVGTDAFLEDIEGFMQDTGLIMITGAPVEGTVRRGKRADEPVARDNFMQHKYRFQLEGTFPDLLRFVNRVENHVRFLEIVDLRIDPRGTETRRGDHGQEVAMASDPRKAIEVVISTYTYSRTTRDGKPAVPAGRG